MTELLWDGKYRDGRLALPDRTPRRLLDDEIAAAQGGVDPHLDGDDGWRNRLICGDTRDVLPALLPEFAGRVSFVYMDPPFATGNDRTITVPLPPSGAGCSAPRGVECPAYRDAWGPGLDGYLQWLFESVTLLRELLADDGAIVVHCDWRADAPLRLILDEVFGAANFRNAIAWAYRSGGASRRKGLARKHDTLLLYARSPRFAVRPQFERQYLRKPFIGSRRDATGRHYVDTLLRDVLDGELTLVRDGQLVRRNLRPVLNVSRERLGYPTQKPLGLIELLIEIASDPGDLVLDCCCGSGTTPAAAALTGRRWIAADSSPFALAATRARLLALPAAWPFVVQHACPLERDDASPDNAGGVLHVTARVTRMSTSSLPPTSSPNVPTKPAVVARPASPSATTGTADGGQGQRTAGGDGIHLAVAGGTCPAPTTGAGGATVIAAEAAADAAGGTCPAPTAGEGDSPAAMPSASSASSAVAFSAPRSPRNSASSAFTATLSVDGLALGERDLPAGLASPGATSGCEWIAYWLVDWEYAGGVFRIGDWSRRSRGDSAPPATLAHTYAAPGRRTIAVRAVDLLGGVTTATLDVDLR